MKLIVHNLKILAVVAVMAGLIYWIGETLRHRSSDEFSNNGHHITHGDDHGTLEKILKAEAAMFTPNTVNLSYNDQPKTGVNRRTLKDYYNRRAYPGAPPSIPHEVDPEINRNQRCNTCHEKGGFVPKFNAYAAITPHPEFSNCLQCHVVSAEQEYFVETNWVSVHPPKIHRPALPGSPPPIPHSLQLRENCLACHAGPAAPLEIRTTHPERENCRQCHVPRETQGIFHRDPLDNSDEPKEP